MRLKPSTRERWSFSACAPNPQTPLIWQNESAKKHALESSSSLSSMHKRGATFFSTRWLLSRAVLPEIMICGMWMRVQEAVGHLEIENRNKCGVWSRVLAKYCLLHDLQYCNTFSSEILHVQYFFIIAHFHCAIFQYFFNSSDHL